MQQTSVTEEQFEDAGELTVRHAPTGSEFSTNRYAQLPPEIEIDTRVLNVRDADGHEYRAEDIAHAARWLLVRKLQELGVRP